MCAPLILVAAGGQQLAAAFVRTGTAKCSSVHSLEFYGAQNVQRRQNLKSKLFLNENICALGKKQDANSCECNIESGRRNASMKARFDNFLYDLQRGCRHWALPPN